MKKITFIKTTLFVTFLVATINLDAQNLVAHFKLDNNLTDASTSNLTMVTTGYAGGEITYVDDQDMNATSALNVNLLSNAFTDFINSDTDFPITGDASRTVAVWIKTSSNPNQRAIAGWGLNASNQKFTFIVNNGDFIRVEKNGSGVNGSVVADGTWKHVAVTYDGASAKLYVNASEVGSIAWSGLATAAGPLYLGNGVQLNRPFDGSMDDLQIYDAALTPAQLTTISSGATLGVNDIAFSKGELLVFPTAVSDFVTIKTAIENPLTIIYSITGKAIERTYSKQIDMSSFSSGIYILQVRSDNKVGSFKIVKK